MKRLAFTLSCFIALIGSTAPAMAELSVPSVFGHHMVLQRDLEIPVWGKADPSAQVTVTLGSQSASAKADQDGNWRVTLPPISGASYALQMKIASKGKQLIFDNVVMGDVWICSGQSNMEWSVSMSGEKDLEVPSANYPNIRFLNVPRLGTQEPQSDFEGQWEICTPATVRQFSAVGYYFGRQIHQTMGVPIGLIQCAWGGSAAEAWIQREGLRSFPEYEAYLKEWEDIEATFNHEEAVKAWEVERDKALEKGEKPPRMPIDQLSRQFRPSNLWNGMLHPLIGYGIRGNIWYQGETNTVRASQYDEVFGLLINQWREAWGQGDFPFYWVQLADFDPPRPEIGPGQWPYLREAQTKTLSLPNTGQAVIYDLGEGNNIHPKDKQSVARRLARIALARDYGVKVAYQGPSYQSMTIDGDKALLTFDHVGGGLYSFDVDQLLGFTIAGEDRVWYPATGSITGKDTIAVSSDAVPHPVAVRYAWADNPVANLMGKDRMLAVPFRTDDWEEPAEESSENE